MGARDDSDLERLNRRLRPLGLEVTVDDIGGRGRCLRATRDFARGELALSSAAFASHLLSSHLTARCAGCFERSARLQRCASCRRTAYCSRACQRRDWIAGHRRECGAVASLDRTVPCAEVDEMILVSRVAHRALIRRDERERDDDDETPEEHPAEPLKNHHAEPLRPSVADVHAMHRWFRRSTRAGANEGAHIATRVHEGARRDAPRPERDRDEEDAVSAAETVRRARSVGLLPETSERIDDDDEEDEWEDDARADAEDARARTATRSSRRNDFAVMDPLLVPLAAASYPLGALLNHSCDPNCVVSYRSRAPSVPGDAGDAGDAGDGGVPGGEWIQEFRCARRVSRGEELTHAYVDASTPPVERREALSRRYGFVCDCARCPEGAEGVPRGCPPSSRGCRPGERDSPRFSALLGARRLLDEAAAAEALDDERRLADAATALLDPLVHDVEGAEGTEGAEGGVPHPALTWRVRSLELALNAAMLAGDWSAAAERGARLVEDRVRAYGTRWHPRVALDLVTLGSARRERDDGWGDDSDSAGAVSAIRDATDVLRVVAGAKSKLGAETEAMLAEARAEGR